MLQNFNSYKLLINKTDESTRDLISKIEFKSKLENIKLKSFEELKTRDLLKSLQQNSVTTLNSYSYFKSEGAQQWGIKISYVQKTNL